MTDGTQQPGAQQPAPQQTQQPAPGTQQPDPGQQQQQQPQTLWPHTIGEPEPPPQQQQELSPEQQEIQRLREQFEQQQQQWNQREQHYQSTLESLMARQYPAAQPGAAPQQQPGAQQPQSGMDFSDLPDPISSPTEFKTKLGEKISSTLQTQNQQHQQAVEQYAKSQALDSVWNRFTSQHGDLAQHSLLVNGASQQLMAELRARGIDPAAVAMQQPDTLVGALAERVQSALQQVSGGQQPGAQPGHGQAMQPGAQQPAPQQQPYQQGTPRTQGFAAGSTTPQAPQQPQQTPSFTEQLKKAQSETGIL